MVLKISIRLLVFFAALFASYYVFNNLSGWGGVICTIATLVGAGVYVESKIRKGSF